MLCFLYKILSFISFQTRGEIDIFNSFFADKIQTIQNFENAYVKNSNRIQLIQDVIINISWKKHAFLTTNISPYVPRVIRTSKRITL